MCGRYSLAYQLEQMEKWSGVKMPKTYVPSYNVAPSQPVVALADGEEATTMRWGYQPEWASKGVINAKDESLAAKPFWKPAKRCAVFADGFYEWKKVNGKKVPYRITPGELFCFAGVYDEKTNTVAIVTTEPNAVVKPIHDRMPVMLTVKDAKAWIAKGTAKQIPAKKLRAYPVSTAVNNPRNNDPALFAEA